MTTIAVLGTGLLGTGFALKALERGETVKVWNRTAGKTAALAEAGAQVAATPAEAVQGVDRVHLVLTADDAVDAVLEAALPALPQGAWVVDHSTNAPARVAERTARLRAQGVRYVHAPVFMAPQNARDATGLMLLAASEEDAAALTPALQTMTGQVWHVGARPDLAAIHKLVGNGMTIAMAGALGDLMTLGAAQGLQPEEVLSLFDVFKVGGSLSFIGKRVARAGSRPASFELTMARKDVGLMLEAAGGDAALSVLPGVARAMDEAIAQGLGAQDFAIYARPDRPRGS